MVSVIILLSLIEMVSPLISSLAPLPVFSISTVQEVETVLGDDLLLHCQVDNLGHHTVSWIRQKDLQILTVGSHKFTTDKRISVEHNPRYGDFMLLMKLVNMEDLGQYECQINTSPIKTRVVSIRNSKSTPALKKSNSGEHGKKKHQTSHLPPKLELPENSGSSTSIIGSPDIYFQAGTLVNITCLVNSLKQPEHIFWYHNGEVISYYSSRGGISIVREEGEEETIAMSSLIIRQAGEEDQGTYTCRPLTGEFKTARTRLFIGQGGVSDARVSRVGRPIGFHWTDLIFILFFMNCLLILRCK